MGGRFKGLVRRSVASLRRGSREVGVRGEEREGVVGVAFSGGGGGCAVLDDEDDVGEEWEGEEAQKVGEEGVVGTEVRDFGEGGMEEWDDGLGSGGTLLPLAYLSR